MLLFIKLEIFIKIKKKSFQFSAHKNAWIEIFHY